MHLIIQKVLLSRAMTRSFACDGAPRAKLCDGASVGGENS